MKTSSPHSQFLVLLCALVSFLHGCGGGSGGTTTHQIQISVRVSPPSTTVTVGDSQQFTATVSGSANVDVTWSVPGGGINGSITPDGFYTAPFTIPNPAQISVVATSHADPTKSATATITIQAGVSVQVTPRSVTLQAGDVQSFIAIVTGTSNQAVTWSVIGGDTNGTINQNGLYTAPSAVPSPSQIKVKATLQSDTTISGTASVNIIAPIPTVTVLPNPVNVVVFGTQQFTAITRNLTNTAVTWLVNGQPGGTQQTGFITSAGLYIAPAAVPTRSIGQGKTATTSINITAISQQDSSVAGAATVILTTPNQDDEGTPVFLGTSGGNQNDSSTSGGTIFCCSGTLGSLVTRGGTQYILSNNHVLARLGKGTVSSGSTTGDNIIEPGLIDANCGFAPFSTVANLSEFYDILTGPLPRIDAALAQAVPGGVNTDGKILLLGDATDSNNVPLPAAPHAGSGLPANNTLIGRGVAKSGRTTGLTCSTILSVATNVTVQYPKDCGSTSTIVQSFNNQIEIMGGGFSAGGDSGSLIVTQDTADPVALLFAASDQDTAGNPVADVLNYFKSGSNPVTFVGGDAHQVVGCTLPLAPQSAIAALSRQTIAGAAMQSAIKIRDANAPQLLARPEVQALGIGTSFDHPGQPAIVFFVIAGQPHSEIPSTIENVRTRIVEGESFAKHGVLSPQESHAAELSATAPRPVYPISDSEFLRAKSIHDRNVNAWMSKSGVQGFGIGSSADAPGEAAIVIFLVRGSSHHPVPDTIDGIRTRIRESSAFVAGLSSNDRNRGCLVQTAKPSPNHTNSKP